MSANVCFVDTETTGLDPDRHEIWEVGLIDAEGNGHHWFLDVDESAADLIALNIGGYFDRHPSKAGIYYVTVAGKEASGIYTPQRFSREFQRLTRGHHLAGAVVSFDADRLHRYLMRSGYIPAWHYHLIDVEALAAGYIASGATKSATDALPPWSSTDLSLAVGVNPDQFDRHTALGDAQWAKAIYEAVLGT